MPGTVTTNYTPANVAAMRGMIKPFQWVNQVFIKAEEQQVMAELIDLQINMQRRIGNATIQGNPLLSIGDQVRIVERETSETYIHRVRSITSTFDVPGGKYEMQIGTNWLGDEDDWAIFTPSAIVRPETVVVEVTIDQPAVTGSTGSPTPGTLVVPATIDDVLVST